MPPRFIQVLIVVSLMWLSWLAMMVVHEAGHVLAARSTGGTVRRVIWHPLVISRTDVRPNPRPRIEVWAGPIFGIVLPVLVAALGTLLRVRWTYLFWFFAGFCLIANGAYIGIGVFHPVGDAHELVALDTPRWALALFGFPAVVAGIWIWDRVSTRLGFGKIPRPIDVRHATMTFFIALILTAVAFAFGHRGM
ncbi:MAG TPA: hypothetical protein VL282_02185 [Tepidisphaeraceae bacterium]|jgi:hypothetical protein|nr:hypothetical protein [Tepidisphaeraceae bacterium]